MSLARVNNETLLTTPVRTLVPNLTLSSAAFFHSSLDESVISALLNLVLNGLSNDSITGWKLAAPVNWGVWLFGQDGDRVFISILQSVQDASHSIEEEPTSLKLSTRLKAPAPPPTMIVPLPTASKLVVDNLGGLDIFSLSVYAGFALTYILPSVTRVSKE